MHEFSSVSVFARRPPHATEGSEDNRLPEEVAAVGASMALGEHDFRCISETSSKLTIDLHAGGTEWIYGLLLVELMPDLAIYHNLSISVVFMGLSRTHWKDGMTNQGQNRTFCEIEVRTRAA
ncbi:hypothetical protein HDU98_006765 [Podochytrium sp. JEL0797]|nr:hypothetical protein HDU98_006765 [Podochytrium sp. JEL0797]